MSGNGKYGEMTALEMSGIADIALSGFRLTKDRSEVVAYTDTLGVIR
jgi:hypothetical protein